MKTPEETRPKRGRNLLLSGLALSVIVLLLLDVFLGSVSIRPSEVIHALSSGAADSSGIIILKFRIPKALTALFVGIALSVSGLQMQTLFRNPMAGPDVLGISSGASLGVACVVLGFSAGVSPAMLSGLGNWLLIVASWVGAAAVMLLILTISARIKEIMTILILGIMLSSGISAVVTILQYFSNESMLKAYVIWTMGSLGNLTSGQLKLLGISVLAGTLVSIFSVKRLNALLMGETYAASLGLNVKASRVLILSCASILTGSATAFCGPISFIGIAVPHISRMIFRTSDHRVLIPGTILAGASVMLASDIVSQLPGSETVIPINSVTALIGIPIVVWIVLKNRRNAAFY